MYYLLGLIFISFNFYYFYKKINYFFLFKNFTFLYLNEKIKRSYDEIDYDNIDYSEIPFKKTKDFKEKKDLNKFLELCY